MTFPAVANPSPFTAESVDGNTLPPELTVSIERAALWAFPRTHWAPRVTVLRDADGNVAAAALTAGRRYSPSRKIVDVVVAGDASDIASATAATQLLAGHASAFAAVVAAAAEDAPPVDETRPQPVLERFEEHLAFAPLGAYERDALVALGFVPDQVPVPSVPSTRADLPQGVRSWSRWSETPALGHAAPYYGQTTDVSCGAVTALMALESAGLGRFSTTDGDANRSWEIEFWRRATNLPACEPVGLAVATAGAISDAGLALGRPRVVLSAEGPVLIEDFGSENDFDRKLRVDLQAESLKQAEQLGLVVERRWAPVTEIRDLVASGSSVFLLIDLEPLIGDPTPHWVLAHDVLGEHSLIVSDPWVEDTAGESWLDVSAQPITLAGIDLITRWGDPAYRGIVVLPRAAG